MEENERTREKLDRAKKRTHTDSWVCGDVLAGEAVHVDDEVVGLTAGVLQPVDMIGNRDFLSTHLGNLLL